MFSSRWIAFSPCRLVLPGVRGCFGPLRSSDQDAVLARVLSPSPVLKALAPPPGTSYLGTPSFAWVGPGYSSVSFELSLSSYGCGSLRSWTSTVAVDSRSNGTWGGSIHRASLGELPGRHPRSAAAPCASRYFENSHHYIFVHCSC